METKAISTTEKVEDLSKRIEESKTRQELSPLIFESIKMIGDGSLSKKNAKMINVAVGKKMKEVN